MHLCSQIRAVASVSHRELCFLTDTFTALWVRTFLSNYQVTMVSQMPSPDPGTQGHSTPETGPGHMALPSPAHAPQNTEYLLQQTSERYSLADPSLRKTGEAHRGARAVPAHTLPPLDRSPPATGRGRHQTPYRCSERPSQPIPSLGREARAVLGSCPQNHKMVKKSVPLFMLTHDMGQKTGTARQSSLGTLAVMASGWLLPRY